ncbi:hypothetical protein EMIHUDRAFT_252551 [Emiliania huxleyi CCMP1516]|uniref:Uncharacterized protein n=2 Tax=Emiliania huxleyi TaxID=2903 RepID=A0A0D3KIY5_EMIH1|nr:hypothetical protein EMIHUDRAFT_252551 [Emiliania huxleyi CCMP1516]EOD35720.1 hypothetical protein EMIHUDRAFT_252551 [Emiliania huxleyi CCMP1516]|eukprot:XP_005788149.1 hypothetical protein EMIHUDRAFT_252551 [Emiliania huxleyi CCMP1516]
MVPGGDACRTVLDLGNCSSYYAGPYQKKGNDPDDDTWRLCRPHSNLSKDEVCQGDAIRGCFPLPPLPSSATASMAVLLAGQAARAAALQK